LGIGRETYEGGDAFGDKRTPVSELDGGGTMLGITIWPPLYFFQQLAQRHSIARAPLGSVRRVRRQPNERLIKV
jgi:hypothetical protein